MTIERTTLAVDDPASDHVTAAIHHPERVQGAGVLLAPGAGGDLDGAGLVALAEVLTDAGHPVVRVNLPYREAGRRTPPRAERSVPAYRQLFDAARARVDAPGWIAGGKSYGGRVASLAAAEGMPVVGLLFYGYPLHPPGKPEKLRIDHWPHVPVRCLFLQGSHDTFCDLELLESALRKLPRRATVHVVDGGDHSLKVTRAASPTGVSASPARSITSAREDLAAWLRSLEP